MLKIACAALLAASLSCSIEAHAAGIGDVRAVQGSYVPNAGSIAGAGTSQQALAANPNRRAYTICNTSTAGENINFGAAASTGTLPLAAGACAANADSYVSTQQINIVGATVGQTYFTLEGQ